MIGGLRPVQDAFALVNNLETQMNTHRYSSAYLCFKYLHVELGMSSPSPGYANEEA